MAGTWLGRTVGSRCVTILAGTFGLALAGLGAATPLQEEAHLRITDSSLCAECSIVAFLGARLGAAAGPGLVESDLTFGVRDARGRYYLYDYDAGRSIKVFDDDGKFLQVIGSAGQGPGEYQSTSAVRVAEDGGLHIFDERLRRLTLLTPEYAVERTVEYPFRPNYTALLLPSDRSVVVARLRTPESVGYPLHVVDGNGVLIASFGAEDGARYVISPGTTRFFKREIATSPPDAVWSVIAEQYRMERWRTDGTRTHAVDRVVDWFDPRTDEPFTEPYVHPFVTGIQEDSRGVLWTTVAFPRGDWRERALEDGVEGAPPLSSHYWDTIVEAFDVRSQSLLGTRRLEGLLRFIDEHRVGGVYEDGLDSYFQEWRLELQRGDGEGR